ncbi:MAG: nucleoside phosphorylase [Deltaproteobacteria bacterium]|nr:nucleoside phosphorylase [Deltaproteobacteria bacterium]
MKERKDPWFPKKVIIAPTDPIYSAVRRAGESSGRDGRTALFRYCLLPACGKKTAAAGPALGAPAAALLMEQLVSKGVREVLLFSVCGSLGPDLEIGDFFLPTGGISEEGTSHLYLEGPVPQPSKKLTEKIRTVCRAREWELKEGTIWTTDAPERETPEKIARYQKEGAFAVDMEFTALATVAHYYGIEFAALMVISDERRSDDTRVGFRTGKFRKRLREGALLSVEAVSSSAHPYA